MSNSDNDDGRILEPMEVWDGALRDEREVEVRDSTIIITHRLTATSPSAVQFQLIDPLPNLFDIDEIGFHPDYEPAHGWLSIDRAIISGVVEPSETVVVKYGLRPERGQLADEVEQLQAEAKASIEFSSPVEEAEADLEAANATRSPSATEAEPTDTEGIGQDLEGRIREMEQSSEAQSTEEPDEEEPMEAMWESKQPSTADATEDVETDEDEDEYPSLAEVVSSGGEKDERPASAGLGGDPFGGRNSDAALASSIGSGEGGGPDEAEAERDRGETEDSGASLVEQLIDELESGDIPDDQRERLMQAMGGNVRDDRSTITRLERLESEMQRFAAYADALEDIIDIHGPADEFLSSMRRDIERVEDSIEDIEKDIEHANSSRDSQRKWLDMLADEVGKIDSRQARIREQIESLQSKHRKNSRRLESRLDEMEPAVGRVHDLEDDLESVRDSVDEVQEKLIALRTALSRGDTG